MSWYPKKPNFLSSWNLMFHRSYQSAPRKSREFYEQEGIARRYYYVLDDRGRIFLEESKHRSYATSLNDKKFLDFFLSRLRRNETKFNPEIPFVSLCGKEVNYVRPYDTVSALTFGSLIRPDAFTKHELSSLQLSLGFSNLLQPFNPQQVGFDSVTGRLYHKITYHKFLQQDEEWGLLSTPISEELAASGIDQGDSGKFYFEWNDEKFPLLTVESMKKNDHDE